MAADQAHAGESVEGVLSEDIVESVTVQDQGGSYMVSIPKQSARDLGITKGDSLLFVGEAGDAVLEVGPTDRVF
ncbi:AbrB/MazE/SpoVT family DNA-binding domain-containing protein [Halomicrobium salinisoli]|uniref:AbrB/MazE/SpoVT family DNA-binding domain-containing protein n=1 Tax=Halomicrobium salinisoli TaxID=2878391 RepID=UPI001CF014B4|nr:AbrB/MazE/SpoVT family DNA-binding domain-containing protein [Halomicrobium salinisoli]